MYASDTFQGIFRAGLVLFSLFPYINIYTSKYTNGEMKKWRNAMSGKEKTTIWHVIQLEFSIIFVNILGKQNCRQPSK